MNRVHRLKCWPSAFKAVRSGVKTFEFSKNDRDFAVGDTLVLEEWDPSSVNGMGDYTENKAYCTVTYCLFGGQFGIPEDYVCMSILVTG